MTLIPTFWQSLYLVAEFTSKKCTYTFSSIRDHIIRSLKCSNSATKCSWKPITVQPRFLGKGMFEDSDTTHAYGENMPRLAFRAIASHHFVPTVILS